jgi:hypothetical protein
VEIATRPPRRFLFPGRPRHLVSAETLAWRYGLVFLLGTAVVAGFMSYHIANERRLTLAHWQARLAFVADAQAQLVADWLKARGADIELVAAVSNIRALLAGSSRLGEAQRLEVERQLGAHVTRAAAAYGYVAILVLDLRGRVVARSSGAAPLAPAEIQTVAASARLGSASFELLEPAPGSRMLSLAVPISSEDGRREGGRPSGVVLVRMDPAKGLYTIFVRESALTRTGETVLFSPPARVQEPTIQPRDALRISVVGHGDLSREYAVDADGTLEFPLIGRTKAGGFTAAAFAMQLQILLEKDYLVNPQVQVAFKSPKEAARFDRGEGAYLSPLRYDAAGWSAVTRSVETMAAAAASAVDGRAGFAEATDYREVPVLAAVRWIEPAGWGLAHKVDRDEALSDFYRAGRLTGLAATLVVLAFAGLLLSLWRQHQRPASSR